MVLRESNAVHLEVLGQAPAAGVPLEVDVFDGANPGTLLATLDGATGIAFTKAHNEVGGGGFQINRHDPKATTELIGRENLFKIKIGGLYRFAFWGEHRELVTLDSRNEQGGEVWQISGREAIAYLDRAVWAPLSYASGGSGFVDEATGKWSFTNDEAGDLMVRAIVEAKARNPDPLEFLTYDFASKTDSQGATWPKESTLEVDTGVSYLAFIKMLAALGVCDFRMRHDLRLQMYVELGRHWDVTSGNGKVVFRAGKHFRSTLRKSHSTSEVKSRLWVKGTGDEFFEVLRPDLEANPYIRRREGVLSFGQSADPTTVQRAGEADLRSRALQVEGGISFGLTHGNPGDYEPLVDYDVGDWVTIHEPGVYDLQTVRIVGLSVEQEENSYRVTVDANTIELEHLLKLARKMAGGNVGGSAGTSANLNPNGGSSGGSTGAATDTKVAVEPGDSPAHLYDKVEGIDGVTKAIAGAAGARKVRLGLDSTLVQLKNEKGQANGYAPLDSGLLVPVGYLGSGVADDTTFLRGDGVWATPVGGGGGGGSGLPLEYASTYKNGAIFYAPSANVWHGVPGTTLDIAAAVGDRIEYHGNWMWTQGSGSAKAKVEIVTAAGVVIRQVPTGTAAMGSSYTDTSKYDSVSITQPIVVEAGDLQAGRVYVRTAMFVSNVARGMYADSGYNGAFTLRNLETGGGGPRGLLYSSKASADTPDDEFTTPSLHAKWAVVTGAAGVINALESGTAVNKYDTTTRPGWLLTQVGGTTSGTRAVKIKQTFTLPDGASIVVAVATPAPTVDDTRAENERQIGIALNNSDTAEDASPTLRVFSQEVDAAAANVQSLASGHSGGNPGGTAPDQSWGEVIFLRISRSGLTYYPFYSRDGYTWVPFGAPTFAAALTRLWIYDNVLAAASGTPVPVVAWAWVRQGGIAYDPWTWS